MCISILFDIISYCSYRKTSPCLAGCWFPCWWPLLQLQLFQIVSVHLLFYIWYPVIMTSSNGLSWRDNDEWHSDFKIPSSVNEKYSWSRIEYATQFSTLFRFTGNRFFFRVVVNAWSIINNISRFAMSHAKWLQGRAAIFLNWWFKSNYDGRNLNSRVHQCHWINEEEIMRQ